MADRRAEAGGFSPTEHAPDARSMSCSRDIDINDSRVRMRATQDCRDQAVWSVQVVEIGAAAGQEAIAMKSLLRMPNESLMTQLNRSTTRNRCAKMFRQPTIASAEVSRRGTRLEIPAGARAQIELVVNGRAQRVEVESGELLVDLVRNRLHLKGTHVGCLTGDCGACTVLLDGHTAKSCTVLAATMADRSITTIEGLGTLERLHPVQQAFWEQHGFQCGFCLPGMLFSTIELLAENSEPTEAEARHALDGNLCRCTGYQTQVAAVLAASRLLTK